MESVDGEEQGQTQRPYEQQKENAHENARRRFTTDEAGGTKKYEPCPRWKNLGLDSSHEYVIIPLLKCIL